MNKNRFIGVDGCKAGWFFVCLDQGEEITFGLLSCIEELWQFCSCEKTLILVDIPIGLPSKDIPARRCDKDARRILSPIRHSSVFSPPSREALNADSYEAACRINQKITGRKISRQAWGIAPKILEMDEFLRQYPETLKSIRETHPEVCFWAINGGVALRHSKKTEAGYRERLAVLTPLLSKAGAVVKASLDRYPGKGVARDDVLDALVLAVAGFACGGKMLAFPETPEKDTCDLPMEIVYCPVDVETKSTYRRLDKQPAAIIFDMLERCGLDDRVFPSTELYNEGWLMRVIIEWFSRLGLTHHPLSFTKDCRWFSEGLIPSPFLARHKGDHLAETWTHADGVTGHFNVGEKSKADISLVSHARHLEVVEAKLFSDLSSGVTNARYFNQAARYVACIAEMLARANRLPNKFNRFGFSVIAPEERIAAGKFKRRTDPAHILETVKRRVDEYSGEKDDWFERWFLPCLDHLKIRCLSWESIIEKVCEKDIGYGAVLKKFYEDCLHWAQPELNKF